MDVLNRKDVLDYLETSIACYRDIIALSPLPAVSEAFKYKLETLIFVRQFMQSLPVMSYCDQCEVWDKVKDA